MIVRPATNQKLVGTSTEGDFVLESQTLADQEGHRNVSKRWFDTTRPLSDVVAQFEVGEQHVETFGRSLSNLTPMSRAGSFGLLDRSTDRIFYPNRHAIRQLGTITSTGQAFPAYLRQSNRPGNAELLATIMLHQFRTIDAGRRFILRVREGNRLTGLMPESGRRLRNRRYLNILNRAIPDGRVSHWRGEDDAILGNILIPDTIREESDSDFGALVAVSNCEVLTRKFSQRPSLFRAICMNGCIWGSEEGNALTLAKLGRGDLDSTELEKAIVANIQEQIPLCVKYVEQLLSTRQLSTDVSMKPVIAQLCQDHRITKEHGSAILRAWNVEKRQTPDFGSTLFGLINGVTRAGQQLDPNSWVRLDELGGRLSRYGADKWESLTTRAAKLRPNQVTAAFKPWSASVN